MLKKRLLATLVLLQLFFVAFAQVEYYTSIDGVKGGATLKTALYNLIKDHKKISYGSGAEKTWGAFYTTDAVVENGQRRVLDMYSNEKRYFGSKGSSVSGMNIEHSVAKSWWGGTENNAYCDLHHLNPSDQNANSRKSNYPLGELTSVTWENGVTFVGKANIDGSSMNAYEPCDEYKGDFARVFMYMFTCYQDLTWEYTWMNYEKSTYPTLKPWAVELLMKWHKQDPVSEKEVNRNNAVYAVQGNRNPYVDFPQLADYVWGDSVNYVFNIQGDVENGSGGGSGDDEKPTFDIPEGYDLRLYENFESNECAFYSVSQKGDFPWIFEYQCAEVTSYDDDEVSNEAESWLVSKPIDLSADSVARLKFDYVIKYTTADKVKEYNSLLISSDFAGDISTATWEIIDFNAVQNETSWSLTTTDEIILPSKYMGKNNVTLAFRYIGTAERAGTFEVDNILLYAIEGDNTVDDGNSGETPGGDEGGNGGNDGNFTGGAFVLVTDEAQLTVGDSILIVYENFVMGQQVNKYRAKTSITISDGVVAEFADDTQIVVLDEGAIAGTFALYVGNGYLAAASSSSNNLVTAMAIDENASWSIAIDENNLATIKAQGNHTRNTLQYNVSSPRFSCYKSGQKSVNIYAKSPVATGIEVVAKDDATVVDVYTLTGSFVRRASNSVQAVEDLPQGVYVVGNRKVLVR